MLESNMLRRPVFWIAFAAISLAAAIFTFKNFSTAFPLVSIDLKMDRTDALRNARSLAQKNQWPTMGFDSAAEFSADQEVQNFIELEGGGKPELARILKEKIFAPYTWHVRLFKEGNAHEALVRFTPEGEPYGFHIKLPEQEKGESKSVAEAVHIAEQTAKDDWNIDFARYELVESSKDVKTGGRTDHTFVYERKDERIREGRYRLRLVVGGDRLTELTHFVQIPEAFTRRYEQMRSANEAINAASSVAVFGLYLLGFCGVGLFFMFRQHWVLWRQPTKWAIFIALLMALQQLNSWPLLWMSYDTAVPASGFAVRQIMGALAIFGGFGVLLTISFMAAETLTRRAFPHHEQLWKVWSRPLSSSRAITGKTLAGYLLVTPFFAYEIVLYFLAQGKLGWWTPSDTLVNPDMFANYLPSLSAIAQAAQAGFWEECLFRAVPLATAALIGDKFGKRKPLIAGAMILQALVFASGHAGYANQPAYARVVELIIPALVFGGLYLAFGLLPGIVLHFTYDTAWMALPLFVSSSGRAHFEQAIVLMAVLVPLWVVLVNRIRAGTWTEVPEDALNGAWKPPQIDHAVPEQPIAHAAPTSISPKVSRILPVLGIAGLAAWILATPFRTDAPPIKITRAEAEQQARRALADKGTQFDPSWTTLSHVEGQPGEINRFVWQTAGKERYRELLGVYVTPPSWVVRFAKFKGDVAERAEEYSAFIRGNGEVFRTSHELPEAMPMKSLTEAEARTVALSALPDSPKFKEVSALADKRPARTDWTFVFKDTRDYGLPQGEARISIAISGTQITDVQRYVFVPEEWSRNERAKRNLPTIFGIVCTIVIVAIVIAGAVVGAIYWSRKRPFSARTFFFVSGAVFGLGALNVLNNWPALAAQASTAQPLQLQVGIAILMAVVVGVFTAVGLGLVAGLAVGDITAGAASGRNGVLLGICTGLALAGATAVARHVMPPMTPQWGNLASASAYIPLVAAALSPVGGLFTQTLILFTVVYALNRRQTGAAMWILVGIAFAGSASIETVSGWLILGLASGIALMLAYKFVFRHEPEVLLIATGTLAVLSAIRDGVQGMYPLALWGSIAGALLVALTAWIWFRGTITN
jgi:hypothetical protein